MRTFIAIDLSPALKDKLLELVSGLRRTRADVKWIDPGAMHLTLKFLGEIDPGRAPEVTGTMNTVAARHGKFPMGLAGTGAFPGWKNPRVLWAGVVENAALAALQADLDSELARLDFPSEDRAFHPHLTLGRVKGPARVREAADELEKHSGDVFGEMTVDTLTFFQSVLDPRGAEYKVIAEARLP
jgi:RNA 2',3'-cyclic 3'-phosphodiesterase